MSKVAAWLNGSYRTARRVVIAIVGFSVLLVGIIMLVTPGPAFVVIPVGLGILAVEFTWARRWLKKIKEKAQSATNHLRGKGNSGSKNSHDKSFTHSEESVATCQEEAAAVSSAEHSFSDSRIEQESDSPKDETTR